MRSSRSMGGRRLAVVAISIALAACGPLIPPPRYPVEPPPRPTPTPTPTPVPLVAQPGPAVASLGIAEADAAGALRSFIESCPRLLARSDNSGLTAVADWQPACAAAPGWSTARAAAFFAVFRDRDDRRWQSFRHRLFRARDSRIARASAGLRCPGLQAPARSDPRLARRNPRRPAHRPRPARPLRRHWRVRPVLRARRDRGRGVGGQGAGNRLGGRSDRHVLPPDPGLRPPPRSRRHDHADRLCRAERARLCRDRLGNARTRPARRSAGAILGLCRGSSSICAIIPPKAAR